MTPQLAIVALLGLGVVAVVGVRPVWVVLATGVFLFVQSAVIRLDAMPNQVAQVFARTDEAVLLLLVVRTIVVLLRGPRDVRRSIPGALVALAAFIAIGIVGALVNAVPFLTAGAGIYLAVKAGLWLYVARFLDISGRTVVAYGYLIAGMFAGTLVIALLQLAGVVMPWQPNVRPISGEFAATSIWSQHTVFGSSVAIAIGLGVFAVRLPGERIMGYGMAAVGVAGVILSSVRRLLVSLPLAAVATLAMACPAELRDWLHRTREIRRPSTVGIIVIVIAVAGGVITWRRTPGSSTWSMPATGTDISCTAAPGILSVALRSLVVVRGPTGRIHRSSSRVRRMPRSGFTCGPA